VKIVLASGNRGKLNEFRALMQPMGFELIAQNDFGIEAAEETATTFVENALIKARQAGRHSGLPAIADDSGICVDVLDGAPGIRSARFAGPAATDTENNRKLLEALRNYEQPLAFYYCAIVLLRFPEDPTPLIATGTWQGHIVRQPRGNNGFGYDPYFEIPAKGLTAAELDSVTKNRISHRGQAVRALIEQIEHQLPARAR